MDRRSSVAHLATGRSSLLITLLSNRGDINFSFRSAWSSKPKPMRTSDMCWVLASNVGGCVFNIILHSAPKDCCQSASCCGDKTWPLTFIYVDVIAFHQFPKNHPMSDWITGQPKHKLALLPTSTSTSISSNLIPSHHRFSSVGFGLVDHCSLAQYKSRETRTLDAKSNGYPKELCDLIQLDYT